MIFMLRHCAQELGTAGRDHVKKKPEAAKIFAGDGERLPTVIQSLI